MKVAARFPSVRVVATLAALLWSAAARADLTAYYSRTPDGPPTVTVRVDERGNSRIDTGGSLSVVTVGGVPHFVMRAPGGAFAVRVDALRAAAAALPGRDAIRIPGRYPRLEGGLTGYRAIPDGTETVRGRTGTRWRLAVGDDDGREGEADWVISDDPDLAPVGAALAQQFEVIENGSRMAVGPGVSGSVPPAMLEPLRRGTILRMGDLLFFHSVRRGPLPPGAAALPKMVLGGDAFIARAGWLRRRGG